MKTILLLVFLINSLFSYQLDWTHNYEKALRVAKKENREIYLFIGADNCRFCKNFKEKTLSKKDVKDKLDKDFIVVYLSRDEDLIPEEFEARGVPRHYFIKPNGELDDEDIGFIAPDMFLKLLNEISFFRE